MSALLIGTYGIYLLLVGISGNSKALFDNVKDDAGGFLPWAVGIGVLAVMYEIPKTRPIVGPFFLLLILNFVLRNEGTLRKQFNELSEMAKSSTSKSAE